ncbi:MAG: carbon-nitrogen hydrolase [Bacteroidaceae bacterium]|nr:carbon-nitrogen hydrolase [Bacteroidaceae bacterium]
MSDRIINVGIIQQSCTADVAENKARLESKVAKLALMGADLVVLQELHNTLYFCQEENPDFFNLANPIPGPDSEWLAGIARLYNIVLVGSLFERRAAGLYHNTAVVFDRDGSLCGKYRKMHIPDDPGYYEKFYFTPGDLGVQPIHTSIGTLGVMVCWDQWYPEAARIMALRGAEILIYPTAIGYDPHDSPEEQQRQREAWVTVQRGHAIANGLPVVSVNRVGTEGKTKFWGSSFAVGPQGEFLYRADDKEAEQLIAIDLGRSEQVRRWWPFLRDRRIEEYGSITRRFDDC